MYVELKNVNKSFGDFKASDNVCFEVEKGQLVALLGPSGSGKTTILRMIAGLANPDSGDIMIDGRIVNNIPSAKRGVGFVFQNYALFRHMSVFDNIAFGLKVSKTDKNVIKDRVNELLELTELKGFEKRFPNELSGGQRQRVAFARALAPEPGLLLLDEPFAAIDAKIRKELRQWLREMIHKVGITSIFVTHDQEEAVEVADKIIVTNKGRIEQSGSPKEIYSNPETAFLAEFIGNSATISDVGSLKGFSNSDIEYAVVRPEYVEAFKNDNEHFKGLLDYSQKGVITDIVFCGNHLEIKLDVNGTELVTHRSLERRDVRIGEVMNVVIYRVFGIKDQKAFLLSNECVATADPHGKKMETYLYRDGGYFTG